MSEPFVPFSVCLYCGGLEFQIGPRGKWSLNITCDSCGAKFNVVDRPGEPKLLVNVLAGPADENLVGALDAYYYCREHDGSGWSVRGPDGFVIKIMAGMDKNVAYIIAKLLSEQWDDAEALLHDFAKIMRGRK